MITGVVLFVVVHPKPYEVFSVIELETPMGTFLFVGVWVHDVLDMFSASLGLYVMFESMLSHWY